jgi:hypothetical protein
VVFPNIKWDKLAPISVTTAAAFCRRDHGGNLRNRDRSIDRCLAQLAPLANVALVRAELRDGRVARAVGDP